MGLQEDCTSRAETSSSRPKDDKGVYSRVESRRRNSDSSKIFGCSDDLILLRIGIWIRGHFSKEEGVRQLCFLRSFSCSPLPFSGFRMSSCRTVLDGNSNDQVSGDVEPKGAMGNFMGIEENPVFST